MVVINSVRYLEAADVWWMGPGNRRAVAAAVVDAFNNANGIKACAACATYNIVLYKPVQICFKLTPTKNISVASNQLECSASSLYKVTDHEFTADLNGNLLVIGGGVVGELDSDRVGAVWRDNAIQFGDGHLCFRLAVVAHKTHSFRQSYIICFISD